MKIKILQEKLQIAISNIEKITGKDASLPILNNILLKTEKNGLIAAATNLETGVLWRLTAKSDETGEVVLPAQTFSALIGSLPGGVVDVESREKIITITSGKRKIKLNGFSADEFPIIPINTEGEFITIGADLFYQSLAQVVNFTSASSIKPEITGVYMLFSAKEIKFVATDSFRLGERKIAIGKNNALSKDYAVIIPLRAAREIVSIFQNNKENINIYFNSGQITIDFTGGDGRDGIQFTSRLIEGEFPDYQAIIPTSYVSRAVFSKKEMLNQLKPAGIFSGKNNEVDLKFSPGESSVKISSCLADMGDYESDFKLEEVFGKDISIVFNIRFLIDGLNTIKDDKCVFEFSNNDGPCLLKPLNDEGFIYILMPIKKY